MRKLPFLLVLLMLSLLLLAAAASAHALTLTASTQAPRPAAPAEDDEAEEDGDDEGADDEAEGAEGEDDEGEDCGAEADELCVDEAEAEAEECLLEGANASVVTAPGGGVVRLTIRYRTFEPTAVAVDARLRGGKGGLHLGSERARFGRRGVYRDSFELGAKQIGKARAAREFDVDLRAVGAPAACELRLSTRAPRRAR
jgi:hypothetical protein